jgi:hypothetical protein
VLRRIRLEPLLALDGVINLFRRDHSLFHKTVRDHGSYRAVEEVQDPAMNASQAAASSKVMPASFRTSPMLSRHCFTSASKSSGIWPVFRSEPVWPAIYSVSSIRMPGLNGFPVGKSFG